MTDIDDSSLGMNLRSFQHFLVESPLEWAWHKVFNYSVDNLNSTVVDEKLDHFFNIKKCTAKVNVAFELILNHIEDGRLK